jgi:hypothetical protein
LQEPAGSQSPSRPQGKPKLGPRSHVQERFPNQLQPTMTENRSLSAPAAVSLTPSSGMDWY